MTSRTETEVAVLKPHFYIPEGVTNAPFNYPFEWREILSRIDAVCRIVLSNGFCGSGFLVGQRIIMTNNHVISSQDQAQTSMAWFFYESEVAFNLCFSSFCSGNIGWGVCVSFC